MQIKIFTTENAQVTIDGKPAEFVCAAINIEPIESEMKMTLTPFLKNIRVASNVSEITEQIADNPETEPDQIIAECNDAICSKVVASGYLIEII